MHEPYIWDVTIKHSTIQHLKSKMSRFASKPYAARDVIEYYHGTLPYFDLGREISDDETYGDGWSP